MFQLDDSSFGNSSHHLQPTLEWLGKEQNQKKGGQKPKRQMFLTKKLGHALKHKNDWPQGKTVGMG